MAIDLTQFHQVYFEESFEGLDIMESGLLELAPLSEDIESINTIFRAAHSIKGGGGTFGFQEITDFTHVLETLLDEMRSGKRVVTADAIELLLRAVDYLREMMRCMQDKEPIDKTTSVQLVKAFEEMLATEGGGASSVGESDASSSIASEGESEAGKMDHEGHFGWLIKFKPETGILKTGNEPLRMFRELASLGEMNSRAHLSGLPEIGSMDPAECYTHWSIELVGDIKREQVEEVFEWVIDDCELILEPLEYDRSAVSLSGNQVGKETEDNSEKPLELKLSSPSENQGASSKDVQSPSTQGASKNANKYEGKERRSSETASIRVEIDKVDGLINMVGELVITQSMLGQLSKDFKEQDIPALMTGLAQLEHNTRELQESVMRIRMLPISFAFARFPRMVRDLSLKLDKKVELILIGEGTELDKTVMEKIGDPLVHLVRNSLDHGLESTKERIALGKPETGRVTLNAFHQGGSIVIEVSDDGAGFNKEKIVSKAIKNGLLNAGDNLSDEGILDLIFSPGFSTADEVSDVSGRGVGMDVVRQNIESLNGSIDAQSTEGEGTVFSIRLPLTLAILDGQMIRIGNQVYILPLVSIVESIQVKIENVTEVVGQGQIYRLREENLPVLRLSELFNVRAENIELNDSLMVVLENNNTKVGVIVDELLDQQQVVIKSLETNYNKVDGISGATILGDGTVALIVDINGLLKMGASDIGRNVTPLSKRYTKSFAA